MPRLKNKGFTARAPQTAASVPEFPDFDARFAALAGGQETNASIQRFWDLGRQRIEFNNGSVDDRFRQFTRTIDGITGSITVEQAITSSMKNYLESRYTLNVTAGNVTTGMTLFAETGPDTEISYVAFQADRFQINTAAGNKMLFSATATAVLLGNVLTVDLANTRLFIGTGTYANANTYFYVDTVGGGRMSLGNKFAWDGSTLSINGNGAFSGTITASAGVIGGWNLGSTTLSNNGATLDSAGQLFLGTSNDVVYLSAVDASYRLWIGNVAAASAAFSVTKAGLMSATGATISGTINSTNGSIGGFTIGGSSFTAGSGASFVSLSTSPSAALVVGNTTIGAGPNTVIGSSFYSVQGTNGGTVVAMVVSGTTGSLELRNSSGTLTASIVGSTGAISGVGSSITALNASNLSSGTVGTAHLGSGSATLSTFLRGDQTWSGISSGNVSGLASSATTDTTNASNISSGTLSNSRLPSAISVSSLSASGDCSAATFNSVTLVNGGGGSKIVTFGAVQTAGLISTHYIPAVDSNGVAINILCQ